MRVHITHLYSKQYKIDETIEDLKDGKLSHQGTAPIVISRIGSNQYFLMDGHHRLMEAHGRGERYIQAEINEFMPTSYQEKYLIQIYHL